MVDDFAPWRRFVVSKLGENHNLRVVGVVSDGLEAVLKAQELQPDLILLDVGMPKINGIETARRIRKVAPNSKILFLSQELDSDVAQAALSEGGHGYVVKSDAEEELFAAVEAVMQGKKFVSRRLASPTFADNLDSQATVQLRREETIKSSVVPPLLEGEVGYCHEVQFYSDDSLFVDGFARFLGAALETGNRAFFLGTASHRIALLEKLHAESPEIRTAIRQGRYVALDAEEFLSNFMVNDMPDRSRFMKVMDDLIVAARKGANEESRIAACGECAPTLWAQGKAHAAIRLEELWNEIPKTYNIDTLCGYPLKSLHSEEDRYTFRRICDEHSGVRAIY